MRWVVLALALRLLPLPLPLSLEMPLPVYLQLQLPLQVPLRLPFLLPLRLSLPLLFLLLLLVFLRSTNPPAYTGTKARKPGKEARQPEALRTENTKPVRRRTRSDRRASPPPGNWKVGRGREVWRSGLSEIGSFRCTSGSSEVGGLLSMDAGANRSLTLPPDTLKTQC